MTKIEEFQRLVELAKEVHDKTRNIPEFGSNTDGGHFINENTLVRVYDALKDGIVADILKTEKIKLYKWEERVKDKKGFDAYVTMKAYRNSITHESGHWQGYINQDRNRRPDHEKLCMDAYRRLMSSFSPKEGLNKLSLGDRLVLPAQPLLVKLVEGTQKFAEEISKTTPAETAKS